MTQASRSGKQNIVEGVSEGRTSKSGEIKLLGVAKSSFEELIADFEDFLRQNGFKIWPKTDRRNMIKSAVVAQRIEQPRPKG